MNRISALLTIVASLLLAQNASAVAHIYGEYNWALEFKDPFLKKDGYATGSGTFEIWKGDDDEFQEGYANIYIDTAQWWFLPEIDFNPDFGPLTHELSDATFDPVTWHATSLHREDNPSLYVDLEEGYANWNLDLGAIHRYLNGKSIEVTAKVYDVRQKVEHFRVPDNGLTLTLLGVSLIGLFFANRRLRS